MDDRGLEPAAGDALIVVDVQRDFLPGGALGVPRGNEIVGPLNRWLARFARAGLPVFATRDWHPADHCSFVAQGGPWPPHCIAGSAGAAFAPGLLLPPGTPVVAKGTARAPDTYSGFGGTDLEARLLDAGVRRVFVGGLATDYCVRETCRDALRLGFEVVLLVDAIRAVDVVAGDGERVVAELAALGARPAMLADRGG